MLFPLFIPLAPFIVILVLVLACMGRGGCRVFGTVLLVLCAVFLAHKLAGLARPTAVAIQIPSLPATPRLSARPHRLAAPSTVPSTQADRLWVNDWIAYVNSTGWQGVRSESSATCVTEEEARNEAIDAAVRQMLPAVRAATADKSRFVWLNDNALTQQIDSSLRSGQAIADSYLEKIEKSYGTLYKQYLLIDTSGQMIDSIVQPYRQMVAVRTQRELTTAGSLGLLSLVLVLLYCFLNAVTRGYFMWRLRAAGAMIMIIAVLAAVMWNT